MGTDPKTTWLDWLNRVLIILRASPPHLSTCARDSADESRSLTRGWAMVLDLQYSYKRFARTVLEAPDILQAKSRACRGAKSRKNGSEVTNEVTS